MTGMVRAAIRADTARGTVLPGSEAGRHVSAEYIGRAAGARSCGSGYILPSEQLDRNAGQSDPITASLRIASMPEFDSQPDPAHALAGGAVGQFRSAEESAMDAALVERMADGDESALGALYDRWADTVNALVARIVRNEPEAEEVVEAVFWQAWQQAGRYVPERGAPGAWLLAMARSRSLDRLRSLRRRRDEQPANESIFDNQPMVGDPLSDLNASDRAARVIAALQQLPAEQREVLDLAYFEGLSQTEIAERLEQPLGTVKTRARLALRKLRDRLDALREVEA